MGQHTGTKFRLQKKSLRMHLNKFQAALCVAAWPRSTDRPGRLSGRRPANYEQGGSRDRKGGGKVKDQFTACFRESPHRPGASAVRVRNFLYSLENARHDRHQVVGDDDAERAFLQQVDGAAGVGGGDDVELLALKDFLETGEHARFVVNDENRVGG